MGFLGGEVFITDLSKILSQMYEEAPEGEKVAMIHLFSIRYAKIIREKQYSANDILKHTKLKDETKISDKYYAEINKGINIAKYVIEKKSVIDYVNQFWYGVLWGEVVEKKEFLECFFK